MPAKLFKNGLIITDRDSFLGDILVREGRIKKIGRDLEGGENTERIDAQDMLILPGGIDAHVHLDLEVGGGMVSGDNFFTGTRAALAGGTTTIIDFVTPQRGESLLLALQKRRERAASAVCDYSFHMSVTRWNERTAAELRQCVMGEGLPSVKVYMTYKEGIGLEDSEIKKVMAEAAGLGMVVLVHCEFDELIGGLQQGFLSRGEVGPRYHPMSRPPEAEREGVIRALKMAEVTGCVLYIVHVSTGDAVKEIREAQARGVRVLAETCPHYLLLDSNAYESPGYEGAKYVMSPPLREQFHQEKLWQGLAQHIIQTVSTDHCPFSMDQKERGRQNFTLIPSGIGSIEHRLELLYSYGVAKNRLSLNQWVEKIATQPAKIFGLYPQKGTIQEGADADLVLWDRYTADKISASSQKQHCDYTVYEGFPIIGKPHSVYLRGELAYQKGEVRLEKGRGQYLRRGPYSG